MLYVGAQSNDEFHEIYGQEHRSNVAHVPRMKIAAPPLIRQLLVIGKELKESHRLIDVGQGRVGLERGKRFLRKQAERLRAKLEEEKARKKAKNLLTKRGSVCEGRSLIPG